MSLNWQDLLGKSPRKTATVKQGPQPTVIIEPAPPPAFGPQGYMADRVPEPVQQPTEVRMKDQVMGGRPSCTA